MDIPRAYGSYEALIEDQEIEAVYISLPNNLHCEWATKAVNGGKHVLCEKPLTRRVADAEALFEAAERNDRFVSEGFMFRHHPQTKRFAELVAEGAIGELRLVRSTFSYSLYDESNIRLRTEAEGGALMDVGCYCVNASRLVAGEPESVAGRAWYGKTGTDWVFSAVMKFPNDALGLFDCGTALPTRAGLEAVGSEGTVFVADPWFCLNPVIELRRNAALEQIELDRQDPYRLELENLSDAIRGEGELLLGRDDARRPGSLASGSIRFSDNFRGNAVKNVALWHLRGLSCVCFPSSPSQREPGLAQAPPPRSVQHPDCLRCRRGWSRKERFPSQRGRPRGTPLPGMPRTGIPL